MANSPTPPEAARRSAIAAEVRATIARAGMKPHVVAAATGIHRATLARRLAGESPFTVDEAVRIATALDVDPASFFSTITQAATDRAA